MIAKYLVTVIIDYFKNVWFIFLIECPDIGKGVFHYMTPFI